jgi:hypothetical protein
MEIYIKALNILENYFGAEEVDDSFEYNSQTLQLFRNSFAPGLKYLLPGVFSFDHIYSS